MTLQEFYAQIGGNYADTVRRLCNESLVLRFVKKYPANPSFDELCAAVDQADWETAFRAVHTLKGISGNLGMGRLCQCCCRMVEQLRAGDTAGARASYNELAGVYRALCGALKGGV